MEERLTPNEQIQVRFLSGTPIVSELLPHTSFFFTMLFAGEKTRSSPIPVRVSYEDIL